MRAPPMSRGYLNTWVRVPRAPARPHIVCLGQVCSHRVGGHRAVNAPRDTPTFMNVGYFPFVYTSMRREIRLLFDVTVLSLDGRWYLIWFSRTISVGGQLYLVVCPPSRTAAGPYGNSVVNVSARSDARACIPGGAHVTSWDIMNERWRWTMILPIDCSLILNGNDL